MGQLQLAEDPFHALAEDIARNQELYIFVPQGYRGASKDLYVREDVFDKLPQDQYNLMMQELEGYQNTGLSGKGADRRQARRDKRAADKQKRIETRQGGKAARAEKFGGILGKVTDTIGNIVGGGKQVEFQAGGGEANISYKPDDQGSFYENNKTLIWVGVGGIALVGGYMLLKPKKK
jgi:hypothetical protein